MTLHHPTMRDAGLGEAFLYEVGEALSADEIAQHNYCDHSTRTARTDLGRCPFGCEDYGQLEIETSAPIGYEFQNLGTVRALKEA